MNFDFHNDNHVFLKRNISFIDYRPRDFCKHGNDIVRNQHATEIFEDSGLRKLHNLEIFSEFWLYFRKIFKKRQVLWFFYIQLLMRYVIHTWIIFSFKKILSFSQNGNLSFIIKGKKISWDSFILSTLIPLLLLNKNNIFNT